MGIAVRLSRVGKSIAIDVGDGDGCVAIARVQLVTHNAIDTKSNPSFL
jgi:hypothetical protein